PHVASRIRPDTESRVSATAAATESGGAGWAVVGARGGAAAGTSPSEGEGLKVNFDMVKGRFGDTVHIREMNVGNYPYPDLMKLFTEMDYAGWILLEARTNPADKVKAMIEQREIFEELIGA
ncbi:MAG: hypothetical protein AAF483_04755, partial [Planctomycetota bacterium]